METTNETMASGHAELEAVVRRAFASAEPEMVGALAAALLADVVELRLFDLLGEDAFELISILPGSHEETEERAERLVALATTPFAINVAQLVRFAQTGEIPERWAPGWWSDREVPDGLEALRLTAGVLLQSLFVRPLGRPHGYESGWWTDPGPIDLSSPIWELIAALHMTHERLLALRGEAASALPLVVLDHTEAFPC